MLTSIMSAVCALALGSAAMTSQADTVNIYMINGEKVENFDGSQLIGKTVSDYKTMTSTSVSNGKVSVTRMHVIRTDGTQAETVTSYTTTVSDGASNDVDRITIIGSDGENSITDVAVMPGANGIEVYIDGRKASVEEIGKISPSKIASMSVYKAGTEGAAKFTDSKDKNVIILKLKK